MGGGWDVGSESAEACGARVLIRVGVGIGWWLVLVPFKHAEG